MRLIVSKFTNTFEPKTLGPTDVARLARKGSKITVAADSQEVGCPIAATAIATAAAIAVIARPGSAGEATVTAKVVGWSQ